MLCIHSRVVYTCKGYLGKVSDKNAGEVTKGEQRPSLLSNFKDCGKTVFMF